MFTKKCDGDALVVLAANTLDREVVRPGQAWRAGKFNTVWILLCLLLLAMAGCAKRMTRFKDGMLNQTDMQKVKDGLATPILIFDGMNAAYPKSKQSKLISTQLYTAYGGLLLADGEWERATAAYAKALKYGIENLSGRNRAFARVQDQPYSDFITSLPTFKKKWVPHLFYCVQAWTLWIGVEGSQSAIADVPKVKAMIHRILELDDTFYYGMTHCLLGAIYTSRPPALGGEPEKAKEHFEAALRISGGKHLYIYILYAEKYCRLVYDRELHDSLLNKVREAKVEDLPQELTLVNTLAKERAEQLLASADEYF